MNQLEGGWLLEDGLDDENSDDKYDDADEIMRVLQEENDDDDVIDETADTDPPLVHVNLHDDGYFHHTVF